MSTPPIQYSGPRVSAQVDAEVRRHLQIIYQKLGNHTQAFALLPKASTSSQQVSSGGVAPVPAGGTGVQILQQNQVLIGNGSAPVMSVPSQITGFVLTDEGTGNAPSFQPFYSIVFDSSPTYLAVARNAVLCNTSVDSGAVTLPLAADNGGQPILVKKISSDINAVNVVTMGGDMIDGFPVKSLAAQYDSVTVVADGISTWHIF